MAVGSLTEQKKSPGPQTGTGRFDAIRRLAGDQKV